jgi:uncharacterized protein YkwD
MNKLTLILALTAVNCFSQTRVDSLILDRVNSYRAEYGLPPMHFNPKLIKVAENQAEYVSKLKMLRHDQELDAPDFDEEPNFSERYRREGIDTLGSCSIRMEVLAGVLDTSVVSNEAGRELSDEEIADMTIAVWKASPEHDKAIRIRQLVEVGISVQVGESLVEYFEDLETFEMVEKVTLGPVYFVSLNSATEDGCH